MMVSLLIVKKLASKQVVVAMPAIISIIRKKNSVLNILKRKNCSGFSIKTHQHLLFQLRITDKEDSDKSAIL
jgi:hypothetical protein